MTKRIALAAALCALAFSGWTQQAVSVKTVPAIGIYVANAALNLRSAPDLEAKVIGQIPKGRKVEVAEMTLLMYPVQGMRAAWFRIVDPAGWVYGYYLDPANEKPEPTYRPEQ